MATFFTIDVEGAFDAAQLYSMYQKLLDKGCSIQVAVGSLSPTTERKVHIRMKSKTTIVTDLSDSLPQCSPASPVLFLIYISPAHTSDTGGTKYSYTDNCGILVVGNSSGEAAAKA